MNQAANLIASFFYVGYSPKAPGTLGSLAALPFAWFLWQLDFYLAWGITIGIFLLGIWASHQVIRQTGKEDNQRIVIDEVVGIFVTTSVVAPVWWQFVLAFCVFRVFDIFKPGPIGWLDSLVKGGFGAMLDDLAAALLSAFVLYMVLFLSARMAAAPLA